MNCPQCQTTNPDHAKFCMDCGASLALVCSNCGTELPATAKFCLSCGHQIKQIEQVKQIATPTLADSGASSQFSTAPLQKYMPNDLLAKLDDARSSHRMEGERRIVTMLFCDVKGSTAMAETLDPEEWATIMNQVFVRMIGPVYQYEGTVARLMGDAILAFFGAPIAHEDDPQRAVLAGLGIVEAIQPYRQEIKATRGLDFDVRVGINTGLVVVGAVGSDLRVEYTAMGDAVNLAARMEQTARPGTVQISGYTYKLVAPLFEVESLGGIEVKGKREPIPAYAILSAKAQPGRLRGIEGLHSPLIGRDGELQTLHARIADLRAGRGQIVSVIGEAGLGKSRLVAELRQSLAFEWEDSEPADNNIVWHEGRCISYHASTPYTPFIDLFSALFGLKHEVTDEQKYDTIKTRLAEHNTMEPAPFIAAMMGIKVSGEDAERIRYLEPPSLRERVFQAVVAVVETFAGVNSLILVFEDLHWADPTSLDLLERLMALTTRSQLMIMALFRPQRQDPTWRFHEIASRDHAFHYTPIMLEPLDESQARTLVANLLQIEDLPEKVRLLILQKAEGNPFFVEEVIRSLLDTGLVIQVESHWRATREIENITLPDTLAGVITARLDRLDENAKRAAQTASVIGREFQAQLLERVYENRQALDPALTTLQQRELIREKTRLPQPVYLFKHVLTQEAAYRSLLLSKRRELHRRTAECLEQIASDQVNDIAWHFLEAGEQEQALPYLVEAGDRAMRNYATSEAIGSYRRALDILETVENLALARRAHEGLGRTLHLANDLQGAVETYNRMLDLAAARNDIPMRISALNKLSMLMMFLGQFEQIDAHLTLSEHLAREHNDPAGLAEMFVTRCIVCLSMADLNGAMKHLNASVTAGSALTLDELKIFGLGHLANTLIYTTRFDEAWKAATECRELAQEAGDRLHLAEVQAFAIPYCYLRNGDLDMAQQSAEEAARIAAQIGYSIADCQAHYMLGQIAQMRGEYQQALEHNQQAHKAALETGYAMIEAIAVSVLGSAYLNISQDFTEEVTELHLRARQLVETPTAASAGGIAWTELGYCVLARNDLEHAHDYFQKGLTIPSAYMLLQKPRMLVGETLIALERNELDEATRLIDEAHTVVEELGMKCYEPLIALTEAQVYAARGASERALDQFAHAEALATAMKMRPLTWQARTGAAALLSGLSRDNEANAQWYKAQQTLDDMAVQFTDSTLRSSFISNAAKKAHFNGDEAA